MRALAGRLMALHTSSTQLYREAWYLSNEVPYQRRLDLACEGARIEKAIITMLGNLVDAARHS